MLYCTISTSPAKSYVRVPPLSYLEYTVRKVWSILLFESDKKISEEETSIRFVDKFFNSVKRQLQHSKTAFLRKTTRSKVLRHFLFLKKKNVKPLVGENFLYLMSKPKRSKEYLKMYLNSVPGMFKFWLFLGCQLF